MSMSFEEYTKQKFDKKKKKTEDSFEEYTRQKFGDSSRRRSLLDDIVPVRKDIAPASKKSISAPTWFQKSEYFKDGTWDKGDLFKTIFGSATDVGENATAGAMGGGEKFLDALAMIGNALYGSQMSQAAENEMIFNTLAGKSNENTLKNYTDFQKQATKGTEEFVKKDLYDEEAIAKKIISAPIKKKTGIDAETASVFGEKSDAVAQSAGQLAATKALSLVGVPWFLTTGGTAFGGQAEQALNEGATYEQAMMSATVSAGAEVLSEKLTGGIKFGSKTLDEAVTKPLIETISNKAVQKLVNVGVDAVGEGSEEVISSFFSRLGTALYKEEDLSEILASEDAFNEYLDGFIGGAFLGGASSTGKAVKGKVKGFDPVSELTDNEQKVVDKIVSDRITEKTKDGNKLTTRDKIKIREAVKTDMEKGRIDIDTLESILGGEAYNNYKSVAEKEEALQNEFNALNKMKQGDMTGEQLDRRAELKQQLEELKSNSKKTELKDKLSKDVFALAKDSRLVESYNEKARRGKAFEADLSKYDAAQQETIKKAVDSGILNNTNRTHEFVDMLAKISADKGVLFDFTSNEKLKNSSFALEGKTVNGYVTGDGNVAVNIDSTKSLNTVVGHEITHILEGTELYDALHQSIVAYAKAKGDYDGRYKTIEKLYEGIEGADINKELTADLVGDYIFTDENFIRNLSTEQPGVFKKVYDEIKYLCKVATAGSKEARELEKIKKTFSDIYRDSGKAQKNTTEEGGVRYSIKKTSKIPYVSQIEQIENQKLNGSNSLYIGVPSVELQSAGFSNNPFAMNQADYRKSRRKSTPNKNYSKHGVKRKVFEQLPQKLNEAVIFIDNGKKVTLVTDSLMVDTNGKPSYIVAGVWKKQPMDNDTVNIVKSVYPLDDFIEQITKSADNGTLVITNKNKANDLLAPIGIQPSQRSKIISLAKDSISQYSEKSSENKRFSLSVADNQYMDAVNRGDNETAQKLIDEAAKNAGYKITGHHGTDVRFTVFDKTKTKNANDFGQGFYFSSSKVEAQKYQNDDTFGDTYNKIDGIAYDNALERIVSLGEDASDDVLFTKIYNEEFDKEVKRRTDEGAIINAYLKMDNPFIVSDSNWITEAEAIDIAKNTMYVENIPDDIAISDWIHSIKSYAKQHDGKVDTQQFANYMGHATSLTKALLQQGKYDGILDYTVGKKFNSTADYHAIALYPNKIKDSAPVTYDDDGNVIPLSQRFNEDNNDIRYSLSSEDAQPVKHGDYHVTGEDVRFAPVRKDIAEKSQNKAQKEQILSNAPPIRKDIAKNATTTPKSMYVTHIEEINVPSGDDITDEPVSITTVKERLEANLQNATTELENNKKNREESIERINTKIAEYQAMYESKKNKDTQVANNLLRSIERLKNNRDNINAQYDKRINDIEKRIDKLNGQLQQDHSKEDNLERALKRIDTRLEREKQELIDAFNLKKGNIEETTADKDAFVSKKAYELYRELWNLKKGVRASQELSAMLDYGPDWGELKRSLLHIKASPSQRVDEDSSIESIAREIITTAYEDELYSVDESYAELKKQLDELDADAEKARQRAREDNELVKRKELHESKINNIKARFSEKGFDFDEVLREAKNLFAFSTVDNTPQRVMEKALGYKQGQILADATVNKVAQNETEGIKWLNSFLDKKSGLLVQIAKEHNIKPGSKESAAAQMYAEGFYVDKNKEIIKYSDNELAIDFPDKTVRRNIKALAGDTRIRQIYDETLEAINEARVRNGYPEIPRLDNYFLHYRAMEDTFSQIGLPFNPNVINAKDLPTDLNGVTADLKPGKPYFASEKHRTGMRTTFDLLGGLERYLSSAKNQIYHIDDIQTLRALRNYIADSFGQAKGLESLDTLSEEAAQEHIEKVYNSHLSTFAKFLNEEANVIAGKTALIDRAVEGIAGRKGITFLDTVNKQVGSNFVGFNVSSAATNAVSVVQTIAKTQKYDCLKAFAQMASNKINSLYGKSDGFAETNPGIIRRKGADKFAKTPYEKVADAGYILASAIDNVSTEFIVRTKFNEFTRKGMTEEQAHIEADKWASRLLGDRSLGQQPQLYNSKMLGLFTKFQLEVRNQLDSMFYDTIQEAKASTEDIENARVRNAKTAAKVTSTFLQLAILQHIFGKGFEAVAGYNPAFDIIDVLIKTLGFDDDEDDEDTALDNIEQGFLALLEDLPYTSTLTGGRVPIANALPVKELITGKDDYGTDKPRGETIKEALPYYLLPGGYGQLKKTAQGINMFNKDLPISGSYTDSGNLRFPVDDTIKNRAQAFLFGQYASENAREYFEGGHAPLTEKQIQEFIDIDVPIADYWKYLEGKKGLETTEDKFDYVNGLNLPVSKKNILINNLVNRKEPVDLENYGDFSSLEEFDYSVKNPGKYAVSKVTGGYESYKVYSKALSNIEGNTDNFGKTISGSRKQNVAKYISGLDADYYTKIILFKSEYNSDHRYDYEIVTHLNSRNDLTYEEKVDILTELGFTVGADGNIGWE